MILNGNHFIVFASMDKKCITQITYEGYSFTCERNDILIEQEIFSLAGYSSSKIDLLFAEGAHVKKGDILLIVEAMKMENNIITPKDGLIESVHVKQGDMVDPSTELVKFV